MRWLSGFVGFRVRTLVISLLVVYLLIKREKLSPVEKQGIWVTGLVFFLARLPFEVIARRQGFWLYQVEGLTIFGLPIDVMVAMAVAFGSGAALLQYYAKARGQEQAVLAQLGLAVLAVLYDLSGAAMYGYLTIQSAGLFFKLTTFVVLTLLSGHFFSWFIRRFAEDAVGNEEV
ncbi:MAG: hypothetical protein GX058_02435 [Firmicutes bacterium]|nr:hypothetical protein [Bacillota bacterium]